MPNRIHKKIIVPVEVTVDASTSEMDTAALDAVLMKDLELSLKERTVYLAGEVGATTSEGKSYGYKFSSKISHLDVDAMCREYEKKIASLKADIAYASAMGAG